MMLMVMMKRDNSQTTKPRRPPFNDIQFTRTNVLEQLCMAILTVML